MDFWLKARSFADEASAGASRLSDRLRSEAVKRADEVSSGASRLSDQLRSEATKRTLDLSAGASRLSDHLRSEAAKQAEELRTQAAKRDEEVRRLASAIGGGAPSEATSQENDLKTFGVTEELTEFVQGITPTTFSDFPLEDDSQLYDISIQKNVRQDLSEWQERHAALVLSTVKEISTLRYELCPRFMKERKFWRIYFILVNSHVAPFEKRYTEDANSKAAEIEKGTTDKAADVMVEEVKDETVKEPEKVHLSSKTEVKEAMQSKTPPSQSTEQDLDVFLLGDLGDSDDGPDVVDGGDIDDDFDKMLDGLDDDDEKDNL